MILIVAEIGLNHDGRWDRAYELIRQAKLAGADIAKFQFGHRRQPGEINHIPPELARRLKEWCDYHGIEMMASIIHEDMFEIARELRLPRYKIASRTVIEKPELVERVLAEGRETFVSLGFWERDGRTGWPFGPPSTRLRYIYCKSKYPTYPSDLVGNLPERFGEDGFFGYSDHTHGIEACLLAAARGARFLEKHFTLDKTIVSVHNDHVLSASPEELAELCRHARALGRLVRALEGSGPAPAGPPPMPPLA